MDRVRKPVVATMTVVFLAILALLYWILVPPIVIRSQRNAERTEACNNARQLGIALFNFENEYGRFPDHATAAVIHKNPGIHWDSGGHSSNDYFRQLIASGHAADESIFYAKTAFSRKPDRRIDPAGKTLAPGEVGFGYLMNGKTAFNTKGNPSRPLACAPLAFDGRTVSDSRFDPSMYDGKAVLLRIDNSVQSVSIDPTTGSARIYQNKNFLETGPDTVWGDDVSPVIVPPMP